jgi:hypothetical protein
MKNRCLAASLLSVCICLLTPAEARAVTRVIDDDGRASSVSCDAATATLDSIQSAVDVSSSGDTILVCPGVYEEQVKIVSKDLTIRGVTSGTLNAALVKPRSMTANSTNTSSGETVAAIIAVEDSGDVTLINLTVDGSDNGLTGCDPTLIGVFYRNASGRIEAAAVRNIRLGTGLEGCQSGIGIFAQGGRGGGTSRLTVDGSTVHDYQKAGIVANEERTELTATANSIVGDGVTTALAQNGIQIGFGAEGIITFNSISNHVYQCAEFICDASTNILVIQADRVTITGNATTKSVVNIFLSESNRSEVDANFVSDSDVFDGIAVVGSRNNVRFNRIFDSDEFGVYVEGDDNRIATNRINDAPCGIFTVGDDNTLEDNTFFNTDLTTCEPFMLLRQSLSGESSSLRPLRPEVVLPDPQPAR